MKFRVRAAGLSLALAAPWALLSVSAEEECDPPANPAPPAAFPADAAHSAGFASNQENQRYLDFRYSGFGDTHYATPATDLATMIGLSSDPHSVHHVFDTHNVYGGLQYPSGGHDTGNIFSSMNVNAAYRGDMWAASGQADNFARRTIHMLGAQFFAMSDLDSGPNLTRSVDGPDVGAERDWLGFDKKYTIGSLSQAMVLKGYSATDESAIIGAVNIGSPAYTVDLENDLDTDTNLNADHRRRWYLGLVAGAENNAWVGRSIIDRDVASGEEKKIGQEIGYHEDDYWDLRPAVTYKMAASNNYVYMDNKRAEFDPNLNNGGRDGGFTSFAVAVDAGILSIVKDSYLHADSTRSMRAFLCLGGGEGITGSPGYFDPAEDRCASYIQNWVGLEVPTPCAAYEGIVQSIAGVMVYGQALEESGGSAQLNSAVFGGGSGGSSTSARAAAAGPKPYSPEQFATAIMRGNVVVGDGVGNGSESWNSDLLRVNGAVKLQGFVDPPRVRDDVPDAEKAGLLYFDMARNTLRLSVPVILNAGTENEKKGVVWKSLSFQDERESGLAAEAADEGARRFSPAEMSQGFEEAKIAAAAGRSTFVQPTMEVLSMPKGLDRGSPVTIMFNQVPSSHFERSKFKLAWRRVANTENGKADQGSIGWTVIEPEKYAVDFIDLTSPGDEKPTILAQATVAGIDFGKACPRGYTGEGLVVQLMAVTAHGDMMGASFRLSE